MKAEPQIIITFDEYEAQTLVKICRKILLESKSIGYLKDFTTEERELCENIETEIAGTQQRHEVAIIANDATVNESKSN